MKLIEYYIELFAEFASTKALEPVKVTRTAISEVLRCSERNVIHIVKKMEEKQWISREQGKGRGNVTTIIFLKTIENMLQDFEDSSPRHQDIERFISLLDHKHLLKGQLLDRFILRLFGVGEKKSEREEYEILKIPYFRYLHSLDPSQIERQTERHLVEQIFNTLVTFHTEKKIVEPCLSYYWERDVEGKRWTFYLRKSVQFHHGKILEAEDVEFSFLRLKETPSKWVVKDLKKIHLIGKHVIQFEFSTPVYCWDLMLSSTKCSIVPLNYGQRSLEEFSKHPIGTGPYQVQIHEKHYLLLTVHEEYFQERAHIGEVAFYILPSIEKYLTETSIGAISYIPFAIENRDETNFQSIQRKHLAVKYLMWNMKKDTIAQNVALRRKVASILDRGKLVRELGYPRYEPSTSCVQSQVYDVVEASYEKNLSLLTYELNPNKEDMEWVKQECSKHGITIESKSVPYEQFIAESHDADLILAEFVNEEVEELGLYNLFLSETSVVTNLLVGTNLIQKVEQVPSERDPMVRKALLEEVKQYLVNEHILFPLYSTYQKAMYHKDLLGVTINSIGLVSFKELFFRK
ncbi:hypothetical protein DS745_04005 [Anaerobacillus alkaliphilus]|uniref:SgrR family transcriptional regulator n=1 Tax=Anaerobacillus alkaliphilus TaxID=1548597 RepID=A0A4Q0VZM3_9BACI|nr:ABC transporter substrate-binding protein [Anaerobacillus alkaliphilus]RXJ04556.1 hypothetical protein DS745_04005 [Anaerobacillus alkaliphilus]